MKDKTNNVWDKAAYRKVLDRYRSEGISQAALGREYNVTRSRMREVLLRAERMESKGMI